MSKVRLQSPVQICTLVTRWEQYEKMRLSFVEAGFDEPRYTFLTFDNSSGNQYEPYSSINWVLDETTAEYVIFCHQDILLEKDCTEGIFTMRLEELDRRDPAWGIAGVAGSTDDFDFIVSCRDPTGFDQWKGSEPLSVNSLDECFLVVRVAARLRASANLSGFHLYGTDLCLNARLAGHSCWVINFPLRHLSAGDFGSDFRSAREAFLKRWQDHFHGLYLVREAELFLSRYGWLRPWAAKTRVKLVLRRYRWLRHLMTIELPKPSVHPRRSGAPSPK